MPLTISFAELSLAVLENCVDIVTGICSPLPILMENDGLTRLYNTGSHRIYEEFLKLLGHNWADLNIIELGAGTGATTARALQCLHPPGGDLQYSRYLFTDISPSFFQSARERFKNYPAIEFAVLDISQPPTKQGIEAESFDLVIASNVCLLDSCPAEYCADIGRQILHATPNIQETLRNVKSLLKPGGRVLIEEICSGELCLRGRQPEQALKSSQRLYQSST
jgi:SAM-dependent methyltransferase